jgi:hypothetical protein
MFLPFINTKHRVKFLNSYYLILTSVLRLLQCHKLDYILLVRHLEKDTEATEFPKRSNL